MKIGQIELNTLHVQQGRIIILLKKKKERNILLYYIYIYIFGINIVQCDSHNKAVLVVFNDTWVYTITSFEDFSSREGFLPSFQGES